MTTVTTKEELAHAIKRGDSEILIRGKLKDGVIAIKVTGRLAWALAFTAIGGAVYLYMATPAATVSTAGAGGVLSFGAASTSAVGAVSILGLNATTVAIGIGIAAGGVGALTTLRDKYRIAEKSNDMIVLRKK